MAEVFPIDLSGMGGLAPKFYRSPDGTGPLPNLRYIGAPNQVVGGVFNPFRRYGYMSPPNNSFVSTTFSGGTNDAVMSASNFDEVNNDFYFAENGAQIWKGDGLDDLSMTRVHNISGAVFTDMEFYMLNGVRKVFYIYKSGGNFNCGEAALPFASPNDNWLTNDVTGAFTNTTTTAPFMRTADNGFAYFFQDNNVHRLDGTTVGGANGTITPNALQFPPYFLCLDAVDYRGRLFIGIIQRTTLNVQTGLEDFSSSVGVYVWDRQSTQVQMVDYIPIMGAREIRAMYVSPKGDLRVITVSSNQEVHIRSYNGTTFDVIQEVGFNVYPNFRDSLQVSHLYTGWLGNRDHCLYLHGQIGAGDKEGLYRVGRVNPDGTQALTHGAMLFGDGSNERNGVYLSYTNESSSPTFKKFFINGTGTVESTAQTAGQGDVYSLVNFLPVFSRVEQIKILCMPTATASTSTAATIKVYYNLSSTAHTTYTATFKESATGEITISCAKFGVFAVQIEIEWPANTLGTDDFAPLFGAVEYEPVLKKK